ncbi:MAG TPA: 3-deoxy-manno-octulosonate cytidylyltransferase [Phycisphaeraceae bacterium]|nr:3-deoxy-manno-octulosonate cytidylyltransferase [Phycisphaeraceae bacterium]
MADKTDSNAVAIIPARWGSTRFPGKPLADETGKPLIQHVCERAARCENISRVVVATDDERIRDAVLSFGGEAVLTSPDHPNGSSRLAEAADILSLPDDCWVCNIQGDEPEIDPVAVDRTIEHVRNMPGSEVGTLATAFLPHEDPTDPNLVKVVLDQQGKAIYFSRSVIPFHRDPDSPCPALLRHIGLYIYRCSFLRSYVKLPPTPLELAESLEQLRILEHGFSIAVNVAKVSFQGIDTPEQYQQFVRRYADRQG